MGVRPAVEARRSLVAFILAGRVERECYELVLLSWMTCGVRDRGTDGFLKLPEGFGYQATR